MSNSFFDVHLFDGNWVHNITTRFTREEKCILFDWILFQINELSVKSMGLELVIQKTQQYDNFDQKNNVYADDVLVEICSKLIKLKNEDRVDILKLLIEQMNDMYILGQCPQGRTTRLFQLYNSME